MVLEDTVYLRVYHLDGVQDTDTCVLLLLSGY